VSIKDRQGKFVDVVVPAVSGPQDMAESHETLELFAAVGRGEISLTAVAQHLGVSYATASSRLQNASTASRRPKKLVACRWDLAVSMLQAGASKAEVAAVCKASIATVTRIYEQSRPTASMA
jgi:transposase